MSLRQRRPAGGRPANGRPTPCCQPRFCPAASPPHRLPSVTIWIAIGFALASLLPAANLVAADQWPRLLGQDFENTAGSDSADVDFTADPTLAWSVDVGEGYGIGVVAGDVYFHHDAVPSAKIENRDAAADVQTAGHQSRLRAIDFATGQTIWSSTLPANYRDLYGYEAGPRASPTVAGDHVYTMSVDGNLVCRTIAQGTVVWSIATSRQYAVVQNFFGVGGSPLVVGDRVYAMVGGSPTADQSIAPGRLDRVAPNNSLLLCADRQTGRVLWTGGNDLASYSSPRTIELDGQTHLLIYARDHLWCFDTDGKPLWKYRHRADILETVNAMVPVVIGDKIFISECYARGGVLLQATRSGVEEIWRDPEGRRRQQSMRVHWSTPVREGDFLYGCSGRNASDSSLRCMNWKTGDLAWEALERTRTSVTKIPRSTRSTTRGKASATNESRLFVWSERGTATVVAATPDRYRPLATLSLPIKLAYPCWASPVIIGNRVLLRGNRQIACLTFPAEVNRDD